MTNEVTKTAAAGALAAISGLRAGLQNVAAAVPVAGGVPILRMGRDGKWIYGQDNYEVEDGSEWAANPMSLQHGYICWKKRPEGSKEKAEKLGEVLVPMTSKKPLKDSLQQYGDSAWQDQVSIDFRCMSGQDEGEQVVYKPSSVGGLNEIGSFIEAIMKQIDADPEHPVPVVRLAFDHYPHPTYGKTYTPVLEIVRWVSLEDAEDVADEAPEPVKEEPKPVENARRTRAPEPAAEQDNEPSGAQQAPAAESGERRRRRRA